MPTTTPTDRHIDAAGQNPLEGTPVEQEGSGQARDWLAVGAGAIRCASGISFLVAPEAANRLWGDAGELSATASLLLRSMGYRDALIGGLLLESALRQRPSVAAWFLASAGADTADLIGGIANHHRMTAGQRQRGLGGAAVGIGIGLLGAARASAKR